MKTDQPNAPWEALQHCTSPIPRPQNTQTSAYFLWSVCQAGTKLEQELHLPKAGLAFTGSKHVHPLVKHGHQAGINTNALPLPCQCQEMFMGLDLPQVASGSTSMWSPYIYSQRYVHFSFAYFWCGKHLSYIQTIVAITLCICIWQCTQGTVWAKSLLPSWRRSKSRESSFFQVSCCASAQSQPSR